MLEVRGLAAGYDGRAVIADISITVGPGEIVALIGANGAGKSTLARTLSGLLPALSGSIVFQGQDITRASASARVRAGLIHVPEGRQIFAGLTVAQNVDLGGYFGRAGETGAARAARADGIMGHFPALRSRLGAYAGNLSGGQQQMLAIARGLMADPKLLILDEPSLGLAPSLVSEIFRMVGHLRAEGIAILLSEQNARMSLRVADRGVVIENGQVVLAGPAHDLLHSADVAARYLGLNGPATDSRRNDAFRTRLVQQIRRTARND